MRASKIAGARATKDEGSDVRPTYVRVLGPDGNIVIRDQPLELVVQRLPHILDGYPKLTILRA